jgi:endonuclease YncB( thermonuclease family)
MRAFLIAILFAFGLISVPELRQSNLAEEPNQVTLDWGVSSLTAPAFAASEGLASQTVRTEKAANGASAKRGRAKWPGPFQVEIVAPRDGDSVVVEVKGRCPFGCTIDTAGAKVISVRLRGIDAPEVHVCRRSITPSCAACPEELEAGRRARSRVEELVAGDVAARVVSLSPDKYRGRVVGDLQVLRNGAWVSVGGELLKAGLAIPYDGGKKLKPWCPAPEKTAGERA